MSDNYPKIRYLVLLLTNRCNLSCKYCYCPEKTVPFDMSIDTMRAAIGLAASHGMPFHVQLSGGEAFLVPELVFATVNEIRSVAPLATIAVQTNAVHLDNSIAAFLKSNRVETGISIDGLPHIHNKNRGDFTGTLRGLETLESFNVPWRVTSVVTDDSIDDLWRLVLFISKFKTARGIGLDFLTRKIRPVNNNVFLPSSQKIRSGITRIMETLDMINSISRPGIRFREADTVARHARTSGNKSFCHMYAAESLAVYPDGSLYPCSQMCGEKDFCAGNINGFIDWSRLRVNAVKLYNSECGNCALKGFCPGDCPVRLYYNNHEETKAVCTLYQTIYAFQNRKNLK